MFDFDNKTIVLDASHRIAMREALELYRNKLTAGLYGDSSSNLKTEYFDIEIEVVDEILELLGED